VEDVLREDRRHVGWGDDMGRRDERRSSRRREGLRRGSDYCGDRDSSGRGGHDVEMVRTRRRRRRGLEVVIYRYVRRRSRRGGGGRVIYWWVRRVGGRRP